MLERKRFHINGQVQGVGFRPCVYQAATKLRLSGWVRNDASGIILEIQGKTVEKFWQELLLVLPPLAKINSVQVKPLPLKADESEFTIIDSQSGKVNTLISPDVTICPRCLTELFNKESRFYLYPFLNCTQCGPRLTIAHQLPYDRSQTAMAPFTFCAECYADYHDPDNRRYHAQPTACSQCGPTLSLSLEAIAQHIRQGDIVALKSLGGYQLICDAHNPAAIAKLRQIKNRHSKPFAMLALNLESAKIFTDMSEKEALILNSIQRPIVLLAKKPSNLPENIAPGLNCLGIMLPSTPLHYLLFHALSGFPDDRHWLKEPQSLTLIVTSANVSEDPMMVDDVDAQQQLSQMADVIVSYNRQIVTRLDDSVLRVINQAPCFIRRARGYVPTAIKLAHAIAPTLALGSHLKNTFCITRQDEAFLSQHIGDLKNQASRDFFHDTLQHLLKFLDVQPEYIVHDMHPDFYTTQLAHEYGLPNIPVQHHHAHLAAVAAECQLQQPALGLALDGYGYGLDGGAWGGELFLLDQAHVKRLSHLQPLLLPGGDKAAYEPWRMGASVLYSLGLAKEISRKFPEQPNAALLASILENNMNTPSSSCGRLFDAAAALLGVHTTTQYEGQAAMKLESLVTKPKVLQAGWDINEQGLSLLPLFAKLLEVDAMTGANLFHGTLIAALTDWIIYWSTMTQVKIILLSGGCFLNRVLTEGLIKNLTTQHLTALFPQQAPPNDGGIALGQAWIGGLLCV